jgi:histone H3/H4
VKNKISLRSVSSLLKKAGAKRCSGNAKKQLLKAIEDKAKKLSNKAISFCQHAKRKTLKKKDILLATKTKR